LDAAPRLLSIANATQQLASVTAPAITPDSDVESEDERQAAVESLTVAATDEICLMQPYYEWAPNSAFSADDWTSTADTVTNPNVTCRSVYDDRLFNVPGFLDVIVSEVEAGAEVRLTDHRFPGFLLVVDQRAAAFTPQSRGPGQITTADVHVGLMAMAFEHAWTRAVAFRQDNDLSPQLWAVLTLVGVGHNNKEIAAKLDLSNRTVRRRVDELREIVNAPDRGALIRHALFQTNGVGAP
jgi:DNA-binding CsgD family transcriptional regulator